LFQPRGVAIHSVDFPLTWRDQRAVVMPKCLAETTQSEWEFGSQRFRR
jgi:hypothetical protein